jgi:hypothetical protein
MVPRELADDASGLDEAMASQAFSFRFELRYHAGKQWDNHSFMKQALQIFVKHIGARCASWMAFRISSLAFPMRKYTACLYPFGRTSLSLTI